MSDDDLFRIETDQVRLTWAAVRRGNPSGTIGNVPGLLLLLPRRDGLVLGPDNWRAGVPNGIENVLALTAGPPLFEQTDYLVYAESKTGQPLSLEHRDTSLLRDVRRYRSSTVINGVINFGNEIGRSLFSVRVADRSEIDFEVEVFPSKLDYKSDYQQIVANIQDIVTGLVFDYLKSTFQLGIPLRVTQPSYVEWLFFLKHELGELERGLRYVAQHPFRSVIREAQEIRAERVRRVDNSVRRAILRGCGTGMSIPLTSSLSVRQHLSEQRARTTLDTPEHRWLAAKLVWIRRRLALLRQAEARREPSTRRASILEELLQLESRISRLESLEPMAVANGEPPANFASVQLLTGPGYREAYRACLILALGLRISGDPIELSIKDLSVLYEYWCFLSIVRCIGRELGNQVPFAQLIKIEENGLRLMLQKGRQQTVSFGANSGRKVSVTYNPRFSGLSFVVPQQPDFLVTVENPEWPSVRLIVDAKYRLDSSPRYQAQYGSPGPPDDAINVLHRYRDAIVETDGTDTDERPKRTVIQGAALFPYRESSPGSYRQTRLWQSLERIGIGAIPMLPDGEQYVSEWVRSILTRGGWGLADKVIPHRIEEHAWNWKIAASQTVLIGVLRGEDPVRHLKWIEAERTYYMRLLHRQRRQYFVKWITIYLPSAMHQPGAVTRIAEVNAIEVLPRSRISTPWGSRRDPDELQVVYRLAPFADLPSPVVNRGIDGEGTRFSTIRWTSRLALDRARDTKELLLETEPEWRLYESLNSSRMEFDIVAGPSLRSDPDDPRGRAWFRVGNKNVQYRGAEGFVIKSPLAGDAHCARIADVIELCS